MKPFAILVTAGVLATALAPSLYAQAPPLRPGFATLTAARTVYLENGGAKQSIFDDMTDAVQRWGRFIVVDDAGQSDITMRLSGLAIGRGWTLTVTKTANHQLLWTDRRRKELFHGEIGAGLIRQLQERLEGSPPRK